MRVDVHFHTCCMEPGDGATSSEVLDSVPFKYMRWRLGIGYGSDVQAKLERKVIETVDGTPELDAAGLLAFDAVYTREGGLDRGNTHLYVTNEYASRLAGRCAKLLFVCSVHPYRKDAQAELERWIRAGAVACKWLPIVQGFSPADPECEALYEVMAHYGLPLLCHTGGEKSLPNLRPDTADPALLVGALKRGVKVIMAHCGTRSSPFERDYYDVFRRCVLEWEHGYGDTSAMLLPTRWYGLARAADDAGVRRKLVHGSDWPIPPLPPPGMVGVTGLTESNWLRRDTIIKQVIFPEPEYWDRAAQVLKLDSQMLKLDAQVAKPDTLARL